MKRTRAAGGVVTHEGTGRILVVSQNGDSWSLPKGHVDPGEDDLSAARREIFEETGVRELRLIKAFAPYERFAIGYGGKGERTDELKTIVMFLFSTGQDELRPEDPKNPEARWAPKEEVAAMLTHPKDREFFLGVLRTLR